MELGQLFAFACVIVAAAAQICPPTDISIVFDQSENAYRASTTSDNNPFQLMQQAVVGLLTHPRVVQAGNNFRVGIYGYHSGEQRTIVQPGTPASQVPRNINLAGSDVRGGSWSYKGLELITSRPTPGWNNLILFVSSQGSGVPPRQQFARDQVARVAQLGWNINVIAVKGVNSIDYVELTDINGGQRPTTLTDPSPADPNSPQGYKQLSLEFRRIIENVLCNFIPTTPTPTPTTTTTTSTTTRSTTRSTTTRSTTTRRTTPRTYGLCSDCLFFGGYGFDFDPVSCNAFWQCLPDSDPIKKYCPDGTFWDGAQCNHIAAVNCPEAPCDANTPAKTRYISGKCCNEYFECINGTLVEKTCSGADQIFDETRGECVATTDRTAACEGTQRFFCDHDLSGPVDPNKCAGYSPDPTGNPCKYLFYGYSFDVAQGTYFNIDHCVLDFTTSDECTNEVLGRDFFDGEPADVCSATFRATFDGGRRDVISERQNTLLDIHSIMQGPTLSNDALVFTGTGNEFYYWYFFNNRDMGSNTAFRVRFRLRDPQLNREYDVLSNNYCPLCPEKISITVAATSATRRVVSATFVTTLGNTVTTSAVLDKKNANEYVEAIVIFGESSVYGQVTSLNGNTATGSADFNRVDKSPEASIESNRCGLQLGKGPNNNFIGDIDDFAVFEYCQDISSILR